MASSVSLVMAIMGAVLVAEFLIVAPKRNFDYTKFVVSQVALSVASYLLLAAFSIDYALGLVDSTTIGSFSLLVTGFFIASPTERNSLVLFYSVTSAILLFIAGFILALTEIFTLPAGVSSTYPQPVVPVWGAFFLTGLVDLIIVSIQVYRVVHAQFVTR